MQTQEKNRDKNLEQATHAAAQPKNKTIFFPQVQFVCCLYTTTTTSFFSTSLNMSDALLMPCDRKNNNKNTMMNFLFL